MSVSLCIRFKQFMYLKKCIPFIILLMSSLYPGGIIDLHLCQKLSINAEVAEAAPLVVDDAVAFAGHCDESWALVVIWSLQSPQ